MVKWKDVPAETIQQIVREGQGYLQGQLTLATSADQRAAVLGGIYAASGTAIFAGLLASGTGLEKLGWGVIAGGIVTAALFLVASSLCISTAMPSGFWLPGNEPEEWYKDVESDRPFLESLGEEAENFQSKIEDNRAFLQSNAQRFKWGAIVGIAAPIAGVMVWGANLLFDHLRAMIPDLTNTGASNMVPLVIGAVAQAWHGSLRRGYLRRYSKVWNGSPSLAPLSSQRP